MSLERKDPQFKKPIAVFTLGESSLTGIPALLAYSLIYSSRGNTFSYMADLVALQRIPQENPVVSRVRALQSIKKTKTFFNGMGVEVVLQREKQETGRLGQTIAYLRFNDHVQKKQIEDLASFRIQEGISFRDTHGRKYENTLYQQVSLNKPPLK